MDELQLTVEVNGEKRTYSPEMTYREIAEEYQKDYDYSSFGIHRVEHFLYTLFTEYKMHRIMSQYPGYIVCQYRSESCADKRVQISQPEPVCIPGCKLQPLSRYYTDDYLEYLSQDIEQDAFCLVFRKQCIDPFYTGKFIYYIMMEEIDVQRDPDQYDEKYKHFENCRKNLKFLPQTVFFFQY